MSDRQKGLEALLRRCPVVPVVTIEDAGHAVPLARALAEGGLDVIEVTLRTPAALEAIRRIAAELPQVRVGAGTVRSRRDVEEAVAAGSTYLVSPGATERLLDAAEETDVPFLPGGATASEAMRMAERGYLVQKFFPAESAGGVAALKALGAPLADLRFCPTGGIDLAKAPSYLALPSVLCIGGSWVAPAGSVAAGDWARVAALAAEAAGLRR